MRINKVLTPDQVRAAENIAAAANRLRKGTANDSAGMADNKGGKKATVAESIAEFANKQRRQQGVISRGSMAPITTK